MLFRSLQGDFHSKLIVSWTEVIHLAYVCWAAIDFPEERKSIPGWRKIQPDLVKICWTTLKVLKQSSHEKQRALNTRWRYVCGHCSVEPNCEVSSQDYSMHFPVKESANSNSHCRHYTLTYFKRTENLMASIDGMPLLLSTTAGLPWKHRRIWKEVDRTSLDRMRRTRRAAICIYVDSNDEKADAIPSDILASNF